MTILEAISRIFVGGNSEVLLLRGIMTLAEFANETRRLEPICMVSRSSWALGAGLQSTFDHIDHIQ